MELFKFLLFTFNAGCPPALDGPRLAVPILSGVPLWRYDVGTKHETIKPKETLFDAPTYLAEDGQGRTIADYAVGQVVFSQGDPANEIFYIQRGSVKLTVLSNTGREAVLAILGPSEFVGESCLSAQPVRLSTATAMRESRIMRITRRAMLQALKQMPELSEFLIAHVLSRSVRVEADLVDQLFNSSEKRLARALLLLANFGKEGRPEVVIPKISQEVLAEMVGTTRPRINFFMNKFRKLGFIEYNDGLHIHSSLLNVILFDQERNNPDTSSLPAKGAPPTPET
jgi:CRP/FNR family transcriptional regulator, cyclic AMP receptor protein